jgi:hypothetical protein
VNDNEAPPEQQQLLQTWLNKDKEDLPLLFQTMKRKGFRLLPTF